MKLSFIFICFYVLIIINQSNCKSSSRRIMQYMSRSQSSLKHSSSRSIKYSSISSPVSKSSHISKSISSKKTSHISKSSSKKTSTRQRSISSKASYKTTSEQSSRPEASPPTVDTKRTIKVDKSELRRNRAAVLK